MVAISDGKKYVRCVRCATRSDPFGDRTRSNRFALFRKKYRGTLAERSRERCRNAGRVDPHYTVAHYTHGSLAATSTARVRVRVRVRVRFAIG